MDKKLNEAIGRIHSLIERMDKLHGCSTNLNEGSFDMLNESSRVNTDSFIDFLTGYKPQQGSFVRLGYIQVYPTDTHYPSDDFYNKMSSAVGEFGDDENSKRGRERMKNFINRSTNTEWDNPTGRGTRAGKPMATKSYPYVIKLTKYTLHWQTAETFNKNSGAAAKELNDIAGRMSDDLRNRLGIKYETPEDVAARKEANRGRARYRNLGPLGDFEIGTFSQEDEMGNVTPVKQEYYRDTEDMTPINYDRTAIRNFLSDVRPQAPLYFGVDEEGNIDPIPKSLGKLLHGHKDSLASKIAQLTDPDEIALANEFANQKMKNDLSIKTFLMQNVAYMCGVATKIGGGIGKKSYFWVNKNPLFLLEKGKTKARDKFKYLFPNMNNEELKSILIKQADIDCSELENQNVFGKSMV